MRSRERQGKSGSLVCKTTAGALTAVDDVNLAWLNMQYSYSFGI